MKYSILSTALFFSFTLAQFPSVGVTIETIYSCPESATEYLTLTVALVANSTATEVVPAPTPSTEVAFQPYAITTTNVVFQTVVQTVYTTLYNVSTFTPPPAMQTSTTSTTETLYPIISIWTTTEEVTSLVICPTRTLNPTYTAQFPLPTEYTWGCPPGYLCRPDQIGCNFEAGIPAENFYCSPDQCIAASVLATPQQLWDTSIYGNSTPVTDPSLRFNVIDHYFNMNPQDYGLPYKVFLEEEAFTFTSTVGYAPTPALTARQAETSVPGTCYPWCNNCLLEAQSVGKTPALCDPNSDYEKDLADCQQCIAYHATDDTASFVKIAPQFQQFMDYCAALSAPPPSPTPPVTVYSTLTVQPKLSSSFTTTITSPVVSSVPNVTSSSTEWLVTSGTSTITFHSSPVVTTQWTMMSNNVAIVFATSPIISASVVLDGTRSVALLTTSTTSGKTSSAVSSVVTPTQGSSATSRISSPTASTPASSTFTGAASKNMMTDVASCNSWFSMLCVVLFVIVGDWY